MPVGAYKINAWGGNLNDAPILPNGIQVINSSINLTNFTFANPSNFNYYNNVGIVGFNSNNIIYSVGQANTLTSVTADNTNTLTSSNSVIGTSTQNNNDISCLTGNCLGPGSSSGFTLNAWNTATSGAGVGTHSIAYFTNWANNTETGVYTGNTASGTTNSGSYDKGTASAISCPNSTPTSTNARSVFLSYASPNTQVQTFNYSATGTSFNQISLSTTTSYNIENGVRLTTFRSTANTDTRVTWVGYKSDNTLSIGALLLSGSTSPTTPGSFYDPSITYSTKNVMIKPIWDDAGNSINLAVLQHSDQYLRIIKYTSWSATGATITGSVDFAISDSPNTWYRLCSTGINGLGAIVYFDPYNPPAFKIRFFNINSSGTTLTFGNPIDLATNTVASMLVMNAEVKWTPYGFAVGIYASDNASATRFFSSWIWPVNKSSQDVNATYSYYPTATSVNYLSNSAYKFGSSSLRLGFVSPTARVNSTTASWTSYGIGTGGNFTVECWINPQTFSGTTGTQNIVWRWGLTNYGILTNVNGGVNRISLLWNNVLYNGLNVSVGTWYHVAVVRTSGTIYLYVNGTRYAGPTGDVTDMSANYNLFSSTQTGYSSYIDEFRISNVARYTAASITPPTNAFTYDTNTKCLYHFNSNSSETISYGNIIDDWGQGNWTG